MSQYRKQPKGAEPRMTKAAAQRRFQDETQGKAAYREEKARRREAKKRRR